MQTNKYISEELLAAYIDGTTTQEQNNYILEVFREYPEQYEEFRIAYLAANISDEVIVEPNKANTKDGYVPLILGGGVAGSVLGHIFSHGHVPMAAAIIEENHNADDRFQSIHNSMFENDYNNMDNHIYKAPQVIGEDAQNIKLDYVRQNGDSTCAIKSQQLILEKFGIHRTEGDLVGLANQKGWFSENGTPLNDMGDILEHYHIPVTRYIDANIMTLTNELAQGHQVMVAVDSGELWNKGFWGQLYEKSEDVFVNRPNHALIVAGIDTTEANNPQVVLTDPGSGDYRISYPLEQFMDSWKDSGFYMVTTNQATPSYNPEMKNFDYSNLHSIHNVGGLPYPEFETLYNLSNHDSYHPNYFEYLYDSFKLSAHSEINFHDVVNQLTHLTADHQESPFSNIPQLVQNTHIADIIHHDVFTVGDYFGAMGDFFSNLSHTSHIDYTDNSNWYRDQQSLLSI